MAEQQLAAPPAAGPTVPVPRGHPGGGEGGGGGGGRHAGGGRGGGKRATGTVVATAAAAACQGAVNAGRGDAVLVAEREPHCHVRLTAEVMPARPNKSV